MAGHAGGPLVWRGATAAVVGARPPCAPVLYVCIPVHNEAATVGVLLWRLRTVLQDAGRDYEVVVYDDASTDATAEVLAPYLRVLPLTVLGGPGAPRRGRTGATEVLVRHVVAHARYPRRDACLLLQGDFTDRAEDVPALLAAFEQGADLVVGRREPDEAQPPAERRLRRMAPWVLRPLVRVEGVDDLLGGPQLFRVAALRDVVRARGTAPLLTSEGWAGAAELLAAAVPFARRVAVVDTPGRYDVRPRPSRLDWAAELRTLARYAWRARGTHARPGASVSHGDATDDVPLARPAPIAVVDMDEAADRADEFRPERPRRARPTRAPRHEVSHREEPPNNAPVGRQSADTAPTADRATASPRRERPARQPRRAAAVGDGAAPSAAADEYPQVAGRERPTRRPVTAHVRAAPDTAGDAAPSAHDTAPAPDVRTRPEAPAPTEAATISPARDEPADRLEEVASLDATDMQPGRRRKRRPRRRARGAGAVGSADDATAGDTAPTMAEPSDVAQAQPTADLLGRSDAAGTPGNAARADHPSDDGSAVGAAAGKRRRRRRTRGRSDGDPSEVPPGATVRNDDG